ncbi:HIT domain-containing protein [bacterium]|nr:HIT domain-containing protein [bacterium]
MKQLWAPWRMAYIERGDLDKECLFCSKQNSLDWEEDLVLFKGQRAFILMNLYPYTNGHLMVAPLRHVASLEDLAPEEMAELMALTTRSLKILRKCFNPQGFNVGVNLGRVAGAGVVDHTHVHIVPRWNGDTNFMPILTDTKVICECLKDTYNKLKPEFQRGDD